MFPGYLMVYDFDKWKNLDKYKLVRTSHHNITLKVLNMKY